MAKAPTKPKIVPLGRVADGLVNVASGMGTGRDTATSNTWTLFNGEGLAPIGIDQIQAAYRSSWLVRKIHDIIPEEMVKAWRLWSLNAGDITKLEIEEKRLQIQAKVLLALRMARIWGGAAIVMGLPGRPDKPAPTSVGAGELKYLFPVSRYHLTVQEFVRDLEDPLFGEPLEYRLSSTLTNNEAIIHPSRVIPFKGVPAPDIYGANQYDHFWGLPLLESINDACQDATVVQRAIAQMVIEAKTDVISIPGLTDLVSTAAGEKMLSDRMVAAQTLKSIFHALVIDGGKEGVTGSGETWETKELNLAHLDNIGRFMLQVAAGAADIPVTRLIGAPPQGMNATGKGDEENFLKVVRSKQTMDLKPALNRLDPYILGSAGMKAADATWDFAPLEVMTPQEQADLDNVTSDTFVILGESGLIDPEALAEVLVAVLDERDTFPGLAEAVKKHPDVPAVAAAAQAAASADAEVQAKLNPPKLASLVPNKVTPRSGAGGVQRRVAKAANDGSDLILRTLTLDEIRDAAPRTLYISRQVMNPQEILNHFRAQGVDGLEAAADLHVTVIYSKTPVDWMKLPADWSSSSTGRLLIPPGGPRVLEMLGPELDVLAQTFASADLGWRNAALIEAGCSTNGPDYLPHITLVDEAPGLDPAALKPYTGRIVLGPERWEEARVKAPDDPDGDADFEPFETEAV